MLLCCLPRQHAEPSASGTQDHRLTNDWRSFGPLTLAVIARSIVFVGMGSFVVLFAQQERGLSSTAGSALLSVFYAGGVAGRSGGRCTGPAVGQDGAASGLLPGSGPGSAGPGADPSPVALFFCVGLLSLILYVPFSLHVSLGQDYLPGFKGTASGVMLGLAVSVGGLAAPALGP